MDPSMHQLLSQRHSKAAVWLSALITQIIVLTDAGVVLGEPSNAPT